jgi:hypothetical protein
MSALALETSRITYLIVQTISTFFAKLVKITEAMSRAKAASELSRMGYYKEAKSIMLGDDL